MFAKIKFHLLWCFFIWLAAMAIFLPAMFVKQTLEKRSTYRIQCTNQCYPNEAILDFTPADQCICDLTHYVKGLK